MKLLGLLLLLAFAVDTLSQSCSSSDADMLRRRRLSTLRASILSQLSPMLPENFTNVTAAKPTPTPEEKVVHETFEALRNASINLERTRDRKCLSDDFFAKPVTFFLGSMAPEEVVTNTHGKRQTTDSGSGQPVNQGNVLSKYRISTDFELPDNLTDVSQAELLLYQEQSEDPNQELRDSKQYVEVQTILESVNQKFVVEGKYVNYWNRGYEVFDITSAVELWVSKGIHGPVVLEVTVFCYSSANCSLLDDKGVPPAHVLYSYSTQDLDKVPRIIVTSKNPVEAEHQKRYRRQSQTGSGVGLCNANQSTCCLKPLSINFHEDLGFDFIISPASFEANYCEGVCPRQASVEPALMTPQLFNLLSRLGSGHPAASIEPCCAGNEYRNLEVLMKVDGLLMIEVLQQVIVTSCRCA